MHKPTNIRTVKDIFRGRRIDLPEDPGVYAFWWVGPKSLLLDANCHIVLKGPGGNPVDVEYQECWHHKLRYPCLYVGKSTNIKKRFSLHIKCKCKDRLHHALPGNQKAKPYTTSCQLRFGIEHVFPEEENPLDIIYNSIGFSFHTDFPKQNAIAERFFAEGLLIGTWRPWFNIDSER